MEIFLGVDGGGTSTRAVLVEASGRVIGQGEAGPSNYHNVGIPDALANIQSATWKAWEQANQTPRVPSAAFLGCAGIKSSTDIARFTSAAETAVIAPAGEITVANDLHNALTGGLSGRPGIALIAGTGTNCLGRDATGHTFMCGGWGWLLDDVGGAMGLTLAAMRAAARAADGRGSETLLLPSLLAFLGLSEPNEMLARLYVDAWSADELAAFAPVVIRSAGEGDATAVRVMNEGAEALAELIAGTAVALDFPEGPEVVLLGGCVRSGAPYQPLVEAAVRKRCPKARILEPENTPVYGAAWNALRAANIHPLPSLFTH
jgi:N-acetylglucosamine kinase-like BadF-type ATPase